MTLVLASTLSLTALLAPALAQVPDAPPVKSLTNFVAPIPVTDSFIGQDKPGPYVLSYKVILADEVYVFVDGKRLNREDYTLDTAKGEVTFVKPLMKRSYARVTYTCEKGKAQANPNPSSGAPLTLALGNLGATQLQLTTLASGGNPFVVLGLGSKQQVLGGGLTSQLYLAPERPNSPLTPNVPEGERKGVADRAGVRLGYGLGNAKNGLDASYLRSGREFAPTAGGSFGMATALQNQSLAGRLNPSNWFSSTFSLTDNRDMSGKTAYGNSGQAMVFKLGGLAGMPTLNYVRSSDDKNDAKAGRSANELNKLDFAGRFGVTGVNALSQRQVTEAKGERVAVDTDKYDLTTKLAGANVNALSQSITTENKAGRTTVQTEQLNAAGKVAGANVNALSQTVTTENKAGTTEVKTDKADLTTKVNGVGVNVATQKVTTDTGKSETEVQTNKLALQGKVGVASVGAERNTVATDDSKTKTDVTADKLNLNGQFGATRVQAVTEKTTTEAGDKKTEVASEKVNVDSKLGKSATLTAQTQRASTDAPGKAGDIATQDNTFALSTGSKAAPATLSLSSGSKTTSTLVESRQGVGLRLQPSPRLTLAAEQKETTTVPMSSDGTAGAAKVMMVQSGSAEFVAGVGTKLMGNVQYQKDGQKWLQTNQYAAEFGHEKNAFQLKSGYIDRMGDSADPAIRDTVRAELNLRPGGGVTFSGGYFVNPVEKDGKVSPVQRQNIGLNAKMGFLDFGGGYAVTSFLSDAPMALISAAGARQYGEYNLQLGMTFNRYTRFLTTVKDAFFYSALAPKGTRTINVGLTHNMGTRVNFTLGGTLTENRAAATAAQQKDYKAEAKLGVKF